MRILGGVVWAGLVLALPGLADEVLLQDGSTVSGKIVLNKKDSTLLVQLSNRSMKVLQRAEIKEVRSDDSPLSYVRFHRYSDRWSRLEVLTRTFANADDSKRVSLVGAVHIADTRYYGQIQGILDRHDAVLFEGIGAVQGGDLSQARLPSPARRAAQRSAPRKTGTVAVSDAASEDWLTLMQTTMAETLDLTFQRDGVDYNRDWWFPADMTLAELKADLAKDGQSVLLGALQESYDPKTQERMGRVMARTLTEASKGLGGPKSMKLLLKEGCADLLATQFAFEPGMDPSAESAKGMHKALIYGRNRVVMKRLAQIEKHPDVKTIAVFYGAAHNPDLEDQLRKQGYTTVLDEWLPAWTMQPAQKAE